MKEPLSRASGQDLMLGQAKGMGFYYIRQGGMRRIVEQGSRNFSGLRGLA